MVWLSTKEEAEKKKKKKKERRRKEKEEGKTFIQLTLTIQYLSFIDLFKSL